jgi:heme-degrading monooxygenase HmoA
MIARMWRGWAPAETADDYQHHYKNEVAAHLKEVAGFQGAKLLRRDEGEEVAFTSIAYFTDMAAVHGFAGDHPNRAVLAAAAREALSHWDDEVTHHEVAADV